MTVSPDRDTGQPKGEDDRSLQSRLAQSEQLVAELKEQLIGKEKEVEKLSFVSAQDDLRASLLEREMDIATRKISQMTQDQKLQDLVMSQLKNQIEGLKAKIQAKDATAESLDEQVRNLTTRLSASDKRRRRLMEQLEVQALDRITSEDAFMRSLPNLLDEDSSDALRNIRTAFGAILEEDRRKTRIWLAEEGKNAQWAVLDGDES